MGSPSLPVEGDTLTETLSGTASANTATNMRVLLSTLALTMTPVSCLPSPGMLVWNCNSCPYTTKETFADVELSGPDGAVGSLVLTHMEPQDTEDASITIENADTRLQLEDSIHTITCPGCQNSMGIKILGRQKKLTLLGDGSEGDLVGKTVVFYDNTRNSKLACGTVKLRA